MSNVRPDPDSLTLIPCDPDSLTLIPYAGSIHLKNSLAGIPRYFKTILVECSQKISDLLESYRVKMKFY